MKIYQHSNMCQQQDFYNIEDDRPVTEYLNQPRIMVGNCKVTKWSPHSTKWRDRSSSAYAYRASGMLN